MAEKLEEKISKEKIEALKRFKESLVKNEKLIKKNGVTHIRE
jgi:hypothetical protein